MQLWEYRKTLCTLGPVPPTACSTVVQHHSRSMDTEPVKTQDIPPGSLSVRLEPDPLSSPPPLPPLPPQSLAAVNLFSIPVILSSQECCRNGIIQYVTSWEWLFSLNVIPPKIHSHCCNSWFLWLPSNTPRRGWTAVCLTIRLLKDMWMFPIFGNYK